MGAPAKRVRQAIQEMEDVHHRYRDTPLLNHSEGSFRATLIKDAVIDAGRTLEDPGTVDQYYFPDKGVIVFDLEQDGGTCNGIAE